MVEAQPRDRVCVEKVGTVFRLERDAWVMAKRQRQATKEYAPPPPTTTYRSLDDVWCRRVGGWGV